MNFRSASALLLLCAPIFTLPSFAQSTAVGSISGRFIGPNGKPVRAIVALLGASSAVSKRTLTATDGTFQFTPIAAGAYSVCAQVPLDQALSADEPYLDSCAWPAFSKPVTLAAGQNLTGLTITAQVGAVLHVRVNDPQKVLSAVRGLDPDLMLTVQGADQLWHPIPIISTDATGRDQAITVPRDAAVSFLAQSQHYTVLNGIGMVSAPTQAVFVASGAKPPVLAVTLQKR